MMHDYLVTDHGGNTTSVAATSTTAAMQGRYRELAENLAMRARVTTMSAKARQRMLVLGEPKSAVHSPRCRCGPAPRTQASELYN